MAITLFAVTGSSVLMPILGVHPVRGRPPGCCMDLFTSRASTAEQRLDEFKDPAIRRRKEAEGRTARCRPKR